MRLLLFLMLASNISVAQYKFFIGSQGDFSIVLPHDVTHKETQKPGGDFVDYFIYKKDGAFQYMISVNRVQLADRDSTFIYTQKFIDDFSSECNCRPYNTSKTSYNNLSGIAFTLETSLEGKPVTAYSVNTVRNGVVFNINFFALKPYFAGLLPEFRTILDSFVVKR